MGGDKSKILYYNIYQVAHKGHVQERHGVPRPYGMQKGHMAWTRGVCHTMHFCKLCQLYCSTT